MRFPTVREDGMVKRRSKPSGREEEEEEEEESLKFYY